VPIKKLRLSSRKRRPIAGAIAAALLFAALSVQLAAGFHAFAAISESARPALQPDAGSGTTLTFNSGSSVKVQQIIGDCDWAVKTASGTCQRTASQTISRANVAGNDIGDSFEQPETGRLIFMFGDTFSNDPSAPWSTSGLPSVEYHQHDPIAWTDSTDGDAPLTLNFFLTSLPNATVPTPLFVEPFYSDGTKVPMGGDDVPHAGLDFNNKTYIVVNTGADFSLANPHDHYYSVLASWDGTTNPNAFSAIRTFSTLPAGHFMITSLQKLTPTQSGGSEAMQGVLTYGIGAYKASQIYLSFNFAVDNLPALAGAPAFEMGANTKYFAGLSGGQPIWSDSETDAMPVVEDVVQGPTIGHLSVAYSRELGLWLMTFDGGRSKQDDGTQTTGTSATDGVYFTYAPAPWGPWAQPQLIFNPTRDNGFGVFIHNQDYTPPGPIGPAAGQNDPNTTRGAIYAPNLIGRFTRIRGNTLSIYYSMSTYNPYTVVEMRSDFNIVLPPDFSLSFDQPTITASAPGKVNVVASVNRVGGFEGNVTVSAPSTLPRGFKLAGQPVETNGGVSFKIKLKERVEPGSYALVFTGKDDTGRERDATLTVVVH
jgi:uncharacterized protein DUF4185